MVHVEEAQALIQLEFRLADCLQILGGYVSLRYDSTDDRCERKSNKQGDREFQGTEKIPD